VSSDREFVGKYTIDPGEMVYCPENWIHKIRNASNKEEWEVLGVILPV
jgi:mannose-6-phosphate isomerase-like protein (cupin superfamily)